MTPINRGRVSFVNAPSIATLYTCQSSLFDYDQQASIFPSIFLAARISTQAGDVIHIARLPFTIRFLLRCDLLASLDDYAPRLRQRSPGRQRECPCLER